MRIYEVSILSYPYFADNLFIGEPPRFLRYNYFCMVVL